MILSKLHIPHLIGMILAGVLIGENGLNLLARDASFELFGKVGIYFIMFLAGLEMDMQNLKNNKKQGLVFGFFTTLLPFIFGLFTGYYFLDYSIPASLLLACILSSHTLVSYPIVGRYGLSKDTSVVSSVVATMIALMFALVFLAGISGTIRGNGGFWYWVLFAGKFAVYLCLMFLILPHGIRKFFRKFTDPVMQFTFVLAVVFFSAATAEMCGLEGILGAFLSGLVLNRFVPHTSPLMNRLEFVGNALFIPYFLIGVGMLVNIEPMFHETKAVVVVIIMVIAGTLSKFIAAYISRKILHMTHNQGVMMFGLSEAHAAGALAMVMVGTRLIMPDGTPLMNSAVLDGVVMMILLSCIISTIATDQAAKKIKIDNSEINKSKHGATLQQSNKTAEDDEKIIIPINEQENIDSLMNTAIMMRNQKLNRGLICLNIINDADTGKNVREHSRECLAAATKVAAAADVPVQGQSRLAVNFVNGTIHAMLENDASEMIIGLHRLRHKGDEFFGRYAKGLITGMQRQLIIVKYHIPVNTIRKMVVAIPEKAEFEAGFYRWVERLARMAGELGCAIEFWGTESTDNLIMRYIKEKHRDIRADYESLESWEDFPALRHEISNDQLLIVVNARPGSLSYNKSFKHLPNHINQYFHDVSLMIIYPDQQVESSEAYTFSDPHGGNLGSTAISRWLGKWIGEMG